MIRRHAAGATEQVRLRHLRAPDDYPTMNEIANEARLAAGIDFYTTPEQLRHHYEHLDDSDLHLDLFLAELDGRLVGYVRVGWHDEDDVRVYEPIVFLDPRIEREDVYPRLFEVAVQRIGELARDHPSGAKVARAEVTDARPVVDATVRSHGFVAVRRVLTMVRPTLDDLPDAGLPAGLEIREVRPEQMEAIFRAESEAFRGEWGHVEPGEHAREQFFNDPVESDTSLWRVAWDGDLVAGSVRSFIRPSENERMGRARGWVEHISVGRPWRRRGLARALIAASFPLLRDRGMTEAALGVDSENPSGAVRLYERCGFIPVAGRTFFSLTLESGGRR